jgi:hypothetical protein
MLPGDQVFVHISGYDVNFTAARVIDSHPFGESLIFFFFFIITVICQRAIFRAAPAGRHTVTIVGCVVGFKSQGASVFISTSKDYENVGLASNISVVRMRAQHRMYIGVNISFFESLLSLSYSAGDTLAVVACTLWNMSEATQSTDSVSPIAYPEMKLAAATVVFDGIGLFHTVDCALPLYAQQASARQIQVFVRSANPSILNYSVASVPLDPLFVGITSDAGDFELPQTKDASSPFIFLPGSSIGGSWFVESTSCNSETSSCHVHLEMNIPYTVTDILCHISGSQSVVIPTGMGVSSRITGLVSGVFITMLNLQPVYLQMLFMCHFQIL